MKKRISKGLILVVLSLRMAPTMYAQTALKAYSFLPGNIATNGQTTLWASIGGYSTGVSAAGNTALKPGVLAEGLSTETVLGVLNKIEQEVSIQQSRGGDEVVINNYGSRAIQSIRLISSNGQQFYTGLEEINSRKDKHRFSTLQLKTGVYLVQVRIDNLPITKKILIKK